MSEAIDRLLHFYRRTLYILLVLRVQRLRAPKQLDHYYFYSTSFTNTYAKNLMTFQLPHALTKVSVVLALRGKTDRSTGASSLPDIQRRMYAGPRPTIPSMTIGWSCEVRRTWRAWSHR